MQTPETPAIDTRDMEILMHRDAHFGGNFQIMIDYYEQEGVGMMPDFDVCEIKRLQQLEHELKQNISELYLPDQAKKMVEDTQKLYHSLRAAYEDEQKDPVAILISDLILSEEQVPEGEMKALVEQKEKAVLPLIHLLSAPSFYDPLYPGYGRAPIFAAKCLAKIQDKRAIPVLFEALGQENFFTDEEILYALRSFGSAAKTFLLKILQKMPLARDNEHAAIALGLFAEDPDVCQAALHLLDKEETWKRPSFATYLIFACSDLTDAKEREKFKSLLKKQDLSNPLRDEIEIVIKTWETPK